MGTINSAFSLMSGSSRRRSVGAERRGQQCGQRQHDRIHGGDAQLAGESPITIDGVQIGDGVTETGALAARPRAGGAARPAAATGIGVGARGLSALEQMSGVVYAGFRLIGLDGGRHRQRHYELFQFLFVARRRSDGQRAARDRCFRRRRRWPATFRTPRPA